MGSEIRKFCSKFQNRTERSFYFVMVLQFTCDDNRTFSSCDRIFCTQKTFYFRESSFQERIFERFLIEQKNVLNDRSVLSRDGKMAQNGVLLFFCSIGVLFSNFQVLRKTELSDLCEQEQIWYWFNIIEEGKTFKLKVYYIM